MPSRDAQLPGLEAVARAAWPGSPCSGREQVEFVLATGAGASFEHDGARVLGFASPDQCRVTVSGGLAGYRLCVVLTHEFGHLAGAEHSDDPACAMHVPLSDSYAPCLDATVASLSIAQASLIARSNGYVTERCRQIARRVVDCVGTRRWMRITRLANGYELDAHGRGEIAPRATIDLSGLV